MRFFKLLLLFCFLFMVAANALFPGSYFGMKRLGLIQPTSQADFLGRGGTGIGVFDRYTINSLNPAALVFINHTIISGNFTHEAISFKMASADGGSNYSNFNGVKLSVPVAIDRLVISLGLQPYSQNDFSAETRGILPSGNEYVKRISNSGGLNQIALGVATSFRKRIYAGIYFNYNFGRVEELWNVSYVSDLYANTNDRIISTLHGLNFTVGLMTRVTSDFYIGAVYSNPVNLDVENYLQYSFGRSTEKREQEIRIPQLFGIGASYALKKRVRLSADSRYQGWSNFQVDGKKSGNYQNSYFIATGLELLPSLKIGSAFFEKWTYRTGFSFNHLNEQNGVTEYLATLGLGIPFNQSMGRIDLAIGYGKRGNLEKTDVEESIFKFMISVNGGERWFVRPK